MWVNVRVHRETKRRDGGARSGKVVNPATTYPFKSGLQPTAPISEKGGDPENTYTGR